MFPTIFSLASEGLGPRAAEGSGIICVAIVGGAIVPIVTGRAADLWSLKSALIVPAACYAGIALYAVSAYLVASGLPHRLLFPVRANFFYDNPLGPLVNGMMSFFAMYPPIFRQPSRAAVNLAGLDEIVRLLKKGGVFVGVHPEGTRKKDDDPYTLLPPQAGIGRLIYHAQVPVIPVFINGLGNSIPKQIAGNVTKKGSPVNIVFGEPVDFGGLFDAAASPRAYKKLSERSLEAIHALGQEEKELRARGVN